MATNVASEEPRQTTGGTDTDTEVQPGQSKELPLRTAPAPATKQSLTGKQEHC